MIENEVLVPFEDSTMLTISSPIWVDGSQKVRPRLLQRLPSDILTLQRKRHLNLVATRF